MVTVLMIIYVFSFVDRTILNLLVGPIKADLGISDTQMSLLMGFSFAAFYAVFGLPVGRMADSVNRKGIIGVGLFMWTVATGATGLVKHYWQFLLLRVGVGVGEATLSPSAYSLITDSFPIEKLGRALSVYSMGIFIGAGLAVGVGGGVAEWAATRGNIDLGPLGEVYPWQLAFIVIGIVGLLPIGLLLLIKEPVRRRARMVKTAMGKEKTASVPISEVIKYMMANWKTFLCHHLGFAILAFSSYGVGGWGAAFMARSHGWGAGQIGFYFMLHVIGAGCLGIVTGGILCDWLAKKGRTDAPMIVGLLSASLWIPTGIMYPIVNNGWVAWGFMIPTYFFTAFATGVAAAAVQQIVPNNMRGQASAVYLLVANLVGMGLGPTGVALITDYVFHDEMMLRYSILIVGIGCHSLAIPLFWFGRKHFSESVEYLKNWEAENT
jgi:MFS family permease